MSTEQKVKILLIESNPSTRLFFTDVFWLHSLDSKFDLLVADGLEAAEKFLSNPETRPDFVFLDLVMAGKGEDNLTKTTPEIGLNLITRIKKDPALKTTKVIIYSSYPEKKYGAIAKKNGADMYIYKSDNLPQDILSILNDLHGQHVESLKKAGTAV